MIDIDNGALGLSTIPSSKSNNRCSVTLEADGSVTFYMYAPNAEKVEIGGMGGWFSNQKILLKPDMQGGFEKNIPDFHWAMHYYYWYVDDVRITNPNAGISYGCFAAINTFEMPEDGEDFYFAKNVAHGTVSICKYCSNVNGHLKECYVYTPPGYETSGEKYPVLYLQHGVGENETGWIWQGKMNFIMDNLIAENKCVPMIIVASSGYSFRKNEYPAFFPGDFDSELINSIIPYIEENFRVKKGRNNRAVAGLSLGSGQATDIAAKHPELFSALGVFSGVAIHLIKKIVECPKQFEAVFMSAGDREKEILLGIDEMVNDLDRQGKHSIPKVYEGYHEWHVWRKSLRDFVQLLFNWDDNASGDKSDISYQRTLMSQKNNDSSMVFFDPVYRQIQFENDEDGNPAGKYPDIIHGINVYDDGTAEFNLYAPEAKEVSVELEDGAVLPLERSDTAEGYWTKKTSQLKQGFNYVTFLVNGTPAVNPDAPVGYGMNRAINFVEVPENDFKLHELKDISHGQIHIHYASDSNNQVMQYFVYTPANFIKANEQNQIAAVVLSAASDEKAFCWIHQGKIANIADHMIFENDMPESVIIMADSTISEDEIDNLLQKYGINNSTQRNHFKKGNNENWTDCRHRVANFLRACVGSLRL